MSFTEPLVYALAGAAVSCFVFGHVTTGAALALLSALLVISNSIDTE